MFHSEKKRKKRNARQPARKRNEFVLVDTQEQFRDGKCVNHSHKLCEGLVNTRVNSFSSGNGEGLLRLPKD